MPIMQPYRIKTIREYHQILGISKPEHPLISVINQNEYKPLSSNKQISVVFDFYIISLTRDSSGNVKYSYGQQQYDFDEGTMLFMAPGQVFSFEADEDFKTSGWMLLIHPDYLWNTALAKAIKQYEYFSYWVHEALHLSEKEETMVSGLIQNVSQEYHSNIDKFSQDVIIAQLELLLTYAERFYQRQFITRKISNHKILDRLEGLLTSYFNSDALLKKGLPTVQYIAETLNVSPNYLSGLLKMLTGRSTLQHIQDKLIDKAKEKLSTTVLSVSEIAYELGFEYPQSFSKLFKTKTNLSPLEFRQSFNLQT
jgi:AraC family transcriptional activator of pobA